ncbi:INO80 complex subunit D-like isoform X2 [Sinocyclocheilus rhinocerous]|uniref:INO80 complex subunit D-like isoform X2 n=1 Tax=Sinocyclocheilus rhinocerous TaxID=307959 RepID=UPI0007B98174|nr:PREDICTED: INO80 complex subunit D-like isoform X2 [Sinocyclocheilus rhinocerous]
MYEGKHIHFSEVDNKPLCSYSPKLCKQRRLNGYAFCIRHVLEDKTAPFKQCEYVAKYNSQRCTNPIPKAEERRYCNSHLQVLGFIPKKERKKKQDALEEVRARAHVESVALNITVPSLALRDTNGLDGLPPSPPCSRLTPMPLSDSDILDPFAFYEEDTDGEESVAQKSSSKRKLPSRPVIGLRVTARDPEHRQLDIEHFSAVTEPCTLPTSPHLPQPPPPPAPPPPQSSARLVQPPQHTDRPAYAKHGAVQTLLCKPAPPQTGPSVLSGLLPSAGVQNQPVSRRPVPAVSPRPPAAQDCPQPRAVAMCPTAFAAPPVCLLRLQHLVQLYAQRQREHGDLFPHLGLDWSEDSTDDEDTEELVPLMPQAWRLQERSSHQSSSNEKPLSRRARLAQLCTYLQERYKHLCRQDRAATRHSRYRYAFRKALLHAASKDSDCTAQLIQKLSKSSQTSTCSHKYERTMCTGTTNGQSCSNIALPFSRHCFQHILLNRSQQLFSSCTARFADGQQCSVPVFDITHQTPLCDEHAKKMDNFLRGDGNRRSQQQQLRRPRKKTKPPALTKKHKKKRRRGPHRPQKPIPPAVPQGNLLMPSLSLPTHHAHVRSPSTPELSADELPDDITNEMPDIPNDLELNQEDFSDVLPRLPDDLQDFDLFEGKNGELLPTTEEAEELVRALQAMGSYPDSLVCLSSMGELTPADGVDHRTMAVFSGSGVTATGIGDLLNGRMASETFPNLELEGNLLHAPTDHHFTTSPSPQPTQSNTTAPSTNPNGGLTERTFSRVPKPDSSPPGSHYSSEHVPSPYRDHISPPHGASYQTDPPLLLEVPLSGAPGPPRTSWNNLPLSLTDPAQFGNLLSAETHLLSTALSTPPSTSHSTILRPTAALSALPQPGLTGLTSPSSSPSSRDLLTPTQPKLQLPQFSAAFGHQLASHSGIPKDLQPSHSSTAPPTGFTITSATAATPPFPQSN